MSALNLNKVVLAGRMTADPELKQTPSGVSVLRFTLAVNRRFSRGANGGEGEQQTDFITMVAWRQTAEFISRYFRRGSALCITGSIQTRKWQDQQGQNRYTTEVVADDVSFVENKADNNGAAPAPQGGSASYTPDAYGTPAYSSNGSSGFEEIPNDSDLPF